MDFLKIKVPMRQIHEMIREADMTGNGKCTYNEFCNMMMPHDD